MCNFQVSLQPSHAVISRPVYSSNGGEASVGAALAVSDTGANSVNNFDHELLALLGQGQIRQEDARPQTFSQSQAHSPTIQNTVPQHQQVGSVHFQEFIFLNKYLNLIVIFLFIYLLVINSFYIQWLKQYFCVTQRMIHKIYLSLSGGQICYETKQEVAKIPR